MNTSNRLLNQQEVRFLTQLKAANLQLYKAANGHWV